MTPDFTPGLPRGGGPRQPHLKNTSFDIDTLPPSFSVNILPSPAPSPPNSRQPPAPQDRNIATSRGLVAQLLSDLTGFQGVVSVGWFLPKPSPRLP